MDSWVLFIGILNKINNFFVRWMNNIFNVPINFDFDDIDSMLLDLWILFIYVGPINFFCHHSQLIYTFSLKTILRIFPLLRDSFQLWRLEESTTRYFSPLTDKIFDFLSAICKIHKGTVFLLKKVCCRGMGFGSHLRACNWTLLFHLTLVWHIAIPHFLLCIVEMRRHLTAWVEWDSLIAMLIFFRIRYKVRNCWWVLL